MKRVILAATLFLAYGCVTTTPKPPQPQVLRGVASWYGQEFAGRTTANGEIFDPMLLTAAHRTLPFGTVVDVVNAKSGQSVRVRINDRGPYIGNRMIDLSYAAARQIGLVEPGKGEVEVRLVRLGRGEREPPAPFDVAIVEPVEKVKVKPEVRTAAGAPTVVDRIDVVEERAGTVTRRRVAADGKTIEMVAVPAAAAAAVPPAPGQSAAAALDRSLVAAPPAVTPSRSGFVVQVGAFSLEENAKLLQQRLTRIGQRSYIDHADLYRVRIGPFGSREEAVRARDTLEANGLSAIVTTN